MRVVDECERKRQALLLPARKLLRARFRLLAQSELLKQLRDLGAAGRNVVERGIQLDQLGHAQLGEHRGFLQLHAQQALGRRRVSRHVVAGHAHAAGVGAAQPFDCGERAGFARAIRPKQAENLAAPHAQVQPIDCAQRAVLHHQVFNFDNWIAVHLPSLRGWPRCLYGIRIRQPGRGG